MATALELDDIQGLVVRGYGRLKSAAFVLLTIQDATAARRWLAGLLPQVTSAAQRDGDFALNVGLSMDGLRHLGVDETVVAGFSEAFRFGMTDPTRSRFLGDIDDQAPSTWLWGGTATPRVDVLLLAYGRDQPTLERGVTAALGGAPGVTEVSRLAAVDLPSGDASVQFREPFGFRDGISQPLIEGLPKAAAGGEVVRAGEFVLGYPNEYGELTDRPLLSASSDPGLVLPLDPGGSGCRDLGRNGTYLAFRQLQQDVDGFWQFVDEAARTSHDGDEADRSTALAAKLVGRWPSGAPLVLTPEHDDPALADENDFTYVARDALGLACPLGAHVRRANPRDSLEPDVSTEDAISRTRRHRVVRRSRAYRTEGQDGGPVEQGLHFFCIGANLSRQFEFLQHTWMNNPNFNGLYDDADPLVGARRPRGATFTLPARPVRRRLRPLPEFVRVRGGGYFFLPGIRALHYLSASSTP
ncbi:MAG: Dyp-type peroxidase [Mycobacterium leprae]